MPPQFAALSPYIKQSAGVVGSVYGYTSLDNIGERNITAKQGELQRFSCAARKEVTLYMVFVLDTNKQPLHPCHPARARKLLRDGKAAVYMVQPFTIILNRVVDKPPDKEYRVKFDYGSRHTGVAILKDNTVCWLGQLEHRTDIKKNLQQRSNYRRRRRSANLRYRKPRFNNRVRPNGWLPPSLMSRVNNIGTLMRRLTKLVPIGSISYENVKFDTQLMQNPDISGVEYQQGTLFGYEVREYLLEKYERRCIYCGAEGVPLEIEHLIPRSRGGSNRISNLGIACHICNQKKNNLTAEEFGFPDIQKKAVASLQDATQVTATRWKALDVLKSFGLPVECGSGGRTKMNRVQLGLPKEHYYDACCVGISTPQKLYFKTENVQIMRAVGRGTHQRTNVNKFGFPRGYLARQKQFFGFQTGDLVKAVVPKGKKAGTYIGTVACRKTGSFDIKTKAGRVSGISYKHCSMSQRANGYQYYQERRTPLPPHG